MTYSKAYKNIHAKTIEASKQLPKYGFWRKDATVDYKIELCIEWLETVSNIYKVRTPEFFFNESKMQYIQTGGGIYSPSERKITLYHKFSLVTLFHEFRHHLQNEKKLDLYKNDIEEDARAWSVSLFATALPRSYENAVSKGILHFN